MCEQKNHMAVFLVFTLCSCLLLGSCGHNTEQAENEEEVTYEITTLPLYVNNEIYIGSKPLLISEEDYFVPYDIILNFMDASPDSTDAEIMDTALEADTAPSDTEPALPLVTLEGVSYISQTTLISTLDWHVYEQEEALYIDNFPFDYSWTMYPYVAHAMGGIDGNTYTNSLEAFMANYKNGHRIFEVDLSFTSDNKLAAIHDWSAEITVGICEFPLTEEQLGRPLSEAEFKELKIKGLYTPLTFEDIVQLMNKFPDIYIVTDTKETEEPYITSQFQYIVDTVTAVNPDLLDRIIPQIYNEEMYYHIMELYDWNSIIYTLYNQLSEFSTLEVVDFSRQNGIRVITTFPGRADSLMLKDLLDSNCLIYLHTFNSLEDIKPFQEIGIHGFYTDFLKP